MNIKPCMESCMIQRIFRDCSLCKSSHRPWNKIYLLVQMKTGQNCKLCQFVIFWWDFFGGKFWVEFLVNMSYLISLNPLLFKNIAYIGGLKHVLLSLSLSWQCHIWNLWTPCFSKNIHSVFEILFAFPFVFLFVFLCVFVLVIVITRWWAFRKYMGYMPKKIRRIAIKTWNRIHQSPRHIRSFCNHGLHSLDDPWLIDVVTLWSLYILKSKYSFTFL